MRLVQQTLTSMSCWCFLLGLAFIWNPQPIQAETSFDHMESLESNGKITGFLLNKQNGSALMHLNNGATFCESDFPNDIRIRTTESGNHQSLRFTITGPGGTWTNTENHVPYDSKQFWPTPGNYTVKAELYSHDNLGGTRYDNETISFTVTDCNAIPSLNCNNGDFVWEGSTRLIHSSNTLESYNLPAIFNNATSVDISEVLATDSYANRGNVTQNDERLKLVFRRNGQMTGMSNYTPDLQDQVQTAVYQGSLGTVQLSNGADELLVVHVGNSQFGQNITNSPNSLDINGICLNANVDPCANAGGDSDGDGVCNNDDCRPNNPNISSPGDACNDGNANTTNDVIQADCSCAGTEVYDCPSLEANIGDPCDDGMSGTINDQISPACTCAGVIVVDCPGLNANIGDACNDGNPNTSNDQVQSDCTCAGTPTGGGTCNATVSVDGNKITVNNISGTYSEVNFLNSAWQSQQTCSSWGSNACGNMSMYTAPSNGTYYVLIKTYDASWSVICNLTETVTISGGGPVYDCPALGANIGDACNDGNPNTTNDHVQANCTCAGTPTGPVYDCPALSANIGDACNDGNPNTSNDVVQANCTCAGTQTGGGTCNATVSVDGNKITVNNISGTYSEVNFLNSAWQSQQTCSSWGSNACGNMSMYTAPSNGTYYVLIKTYDASWSVICNLTETVTISGGGPVYDCPALGANIGDTCNDGNPNTTNDHVQANCTCAGTPTGPVYDCPALGANIGDACNDGNANTSNDQVQADCTCAGTPTGGGTCNATVSVSGNKVTVTGVTGTYQQVIVSDASWNTVYSCDTWGGTTCGSSPMYTATTAGSYYVTVKSYTAAWSTICNIFETVNLSGGGTGGCDNVTDGGTIGGDETGCGAYNPGMITNVAAPSGGSGALEYLWLSSTTSCPRYLTQAIDGANGATYNPGTITQTTYYVRCSRRAGCTAWNIGESNCVVKTVDDDCNEDTCAERAVTNSTSCGSGATYGIYNGGDYHTITDGWFIEYNDGTAKLTGHANGLGAIDVTFTGRTTNGTPKFNNCVGTVSTSDWYYYTSFSGTIGHLTIFPRGEEFHVGTGGNNQQAGAFGASGWWEATNGAIGDINILLDGSPNACNMGGSTFDCPALNANIGDACNDGNANTENDQVQTDCSCAGTAIGGGCNLIITSGTDFIEVSGIVGAYPTVGILDDSGNQIYSCHAFNGGCPTTVRVDGLAPGVYWVNANVVDSDWVTVLCDAFEDPIVGGARMGNGNTNFKVEGLNVQTTEEAVDFKLFPNPASETVNVSLMGYEGKDVIIQLVDYTGKPVKSLSIDNVSDTHVAIPIERFSNGIYTVRIVSAGIKPVGKKMIINK